MSAEFSLSEADNDRIVAAIAAAERKTSGEIRVVVSRRKTDDAVAEARQHFERLGMTKTAARNGVLILIAPASHAFAVIGDTGIHAQCGDTFWTELADAMSGEFRRGAFADGLVLAITRAGQLLAEHFPISPDDRNELSNDIEHA